MALPVTLVTLGGVPVQLVDQTGSVFPTTGTGSLVFNTTPTLITPILGAATGTSLALGGASGATLAVTGTAAISGKTLFASTVGINQADPGTSIGLRIVGPGASTTTHGIYLTDNGGNVSFDVYDNGTTLLGRLSRPTTATTGFPYIPSGAGAPTGVPTVFTGMVPLYYDTTNKQFWIYDGAWLQPKTPAGAAIVTWQ